MLLWFSRIEIHLWILLEFVIHVICILLKARRLILNHARMRRRALLVIVHGSIVWKNLLLRSESLVLVHFVMLIASILKALILQLRLIVHYWFSGMPKMGWTAADLMFCSPGMIFKAAVGVEMGGMLKPLHFIFIILMIHFWRLLRPEGCSVFEGIVVGVLINWLPIIILYEFMAWLHNLI